MKGKLRGESGIEVVDDQDGVNRRTIRVAIDVERIERVGPGARTRIEGSRRDGQHGPLFQKLRAEGAVTWGGGAQAAGRARDFRHRAAMFRHCDKPSGESQSIDCGKVARRAAVA